MIERGRKSREQIEFFSIEEFVPSDHLLRKIDRAVDFTHIYDIVEELYCKDKNGYVMDMKYACTYEFIGGFFSDRGCLRFGDD